MGESVAGFETLCALCAAALRGETRPAADAAGLLPLAERHRVVPLLAAGLGPERPPDLRRRALALAQQGIRLEQELAVLADILSAAGIGFLLVKGPALARQAYPAPELRVSDDLDLWVATRDLDSAVRALEAAGYVRPPPLDARRAACARRAGIEVALRHRERGRLVEVAHGARALAPSRRAAREVVAAAVTIEAGSAAIRAPAPVHALLLTCLHGAHHGWDRLGWVVDVAGLWMRLSAAQRAKTLATARRWRVETALGVGLRLAAAHLRLEPDGAARALADAPCAQALAARTRLGRMGPDAPRTAMIDRLRFERDAADSRCRRLRILAGWVFTPTMGDFDAVRLPAALYPLYAVLRPIRLLRHPWLARWFGGH